MKKDFKFSVIIPIYNVENYLEETILSVINQSIGFEDTTQLILVNDGSKDASETICLKYQAQYPQNILYIEQKNQGVSVARNNGLKHATGEIINFLDSDDKWSLNTFEKIYKIFKTHKNEFDVISCIIEFFGEKTGINHPLNYKYKKERIINIIANPEMIQMSNSICFIKRKAIKEEFNKNLKYGEDALFINKIILEKNKYYVVNDCKYMYRKRAENNSALDSCMYDKDFYFKTLDNFHFEMFNYSLKKYKYIIPYVQQMIMYDLGWRFPKSPDILSVEERKEYISKIKQLLCNISDKVIFSQKNISNLIKLKVIEMKYSKRVDDKYIFSDGIIYYENIPISNIVNNALYINIINIDKREIKIYGKISTVDNIKNYKLILNINGKDFEVKIDQSRHFYHTFLDQKIQNIGVFNISVPLAENIEITFFATRNKQRINLKPNFSIFSHLNQNYKFIYKKNEKSLYLENNTIKYKKINCIKSLKFEVYNIYKLVKNKKIKQLIFRTSIKFLSLFKRKEIWLISDRPKAAGDNGIALFEYLNKINDKNIKFYFNIDKNCCDYHKVKKIGKIIPYDSIKYKIYYALSDKIISSQADAYLINLFGKSEKYYRDIYKFDFVFLQHGITKDDLSDWLNIYNKNIRLFISAAEKEYNSFINGDYGYTSREIVETGFARFDKLETNPEKLILIMPTWRQSLAGKLKNGNREYSELLKNSEYYKFYNSLMNDKDIIKKMKENNYKGLFVLHPAFIENIKDFDENEVFKIQKGFANYSELFSRAKLMITDYSSVFFDFAYLRKKVIYTQFDKEDFFKNHTYSEGYFKYEKDAFGPVIYNFEDAKKEIIKSIDNNCELEKKYIDKINKFYSYDDKNNCERIYNEIKKI